MTGKATPILEMTVFLNNKPFSVKSVSFPYLGCSLLDYLPFSIIKELCLGDPSQCGHSVLLCMGGKHGPVNEVPGHRVGEQEGDKPAGQSEGLDSFVQSEIVRGGAVVPVCDFQHIN